MQTRVGCDHKRILLNVSRTIIRSNTTLRIRDCMNLWRGGGLVVGVIKYSAAAAGNEQHLQPTPSYQPHPAYRLQTCWLIKLHYRYGLHVSLPNPITTLGGRLANRNDISTPHRRKSIAGFLTAYRLCDRACRIGFRYFSLF